MSCLVADIAVGVSVNKTFHYRVPDELQSRLLPGSRVLVPFGSRRIPGTVLALFDRSDPAGLKPVLEDLDAPLAPELLELACWISDYYLHPIGRTIETIIPKALSRAKVKKKRYLRLRADASGAPASPLKGKKQAELARLLAGRECLGIEALREFSSQTIRSLCSAGIAEIIEQESKEDPVSGEFRPGPLPVLMPEQADAVKRIGEAVVAGCFAPFLLHGVTGSGKTEVYLRTISLLAGTGKGAIVLVPEIALTPQLLSRFRQRFGSRVAVLHSGLTDRERADEYRRILRGSVDVAIGARSAVFAPFADLGFIVVDEEHENSYKQDEGLRYHARDVAVMRAKFQKAVVVLGSATPSLESYYNAQNGKYIYLRLENRVDHRPLPEATVVDMKAIPQQSLLSPDLINGINLRLEKKEQVLLLLNRRGFSSVLLCRECGVALKCPGCSVSLTYHKSNLTLRCHYCGFTAPPPVRCPACSGIELKLLGTGTQKIEEELLVLFPHARIRRMDSDTVKGREAYDTLLGQVDRREIDILLGTQMIAKGHDFPSVTLVGIVDADIGLNLPDFRSAEKTFQLITQAAGRAGRGEVNGDVIIQTMNPHHYSIIHSRTHDYDGFYRQELGYRIDLVYPPISRIVKLEFRSMTESGSAAGAETARNRIRNLITSKGVAVLGPAPAPVSRVRGQFRFQMLLLSKNRDELRRLAREGRQAVEEKHGRSCKVVVDMDPVNLM